MAAANIIGSGLGFGHGIFRGHAYTTVCRHFYVIIIIAEGNYIFVINIQALYDG